MATYKTVIAIAMGLVLAGASFVQAQSRCVAQCDALLEQCRRSCENQENPDQCLDDCRRFHQQCVAACD